jgi:hypothetical protein
MRRPALVLLLLVLAAGCGPSGEQSVSPSRAPAANPTARAAIPLGETVGEPLAGGRYTHVGFEPPITFEANASWQAVQLLDGFFDIQHDPGSPDVIAVQFANVDAVYGADPEAPIAVTSVADAVAVFADNPRIGVVEESDSRIGGLEGSNVVVENTGSADAAVLRVPPGPLAISPDRRLWMSLFDTPDGVLAIMVGGSISGWEEALAAAEPVLESVAVVSPSR